ncbi:MAG: hypothetical protein P4L33_19795 [Capsulimonadaceae bacterium]|nr:hypothetical protein [Capsulimonadaceae bacterium]
MKAIDRALASITIGPVASYRGLHIYPLLAQGDRPSEHSTAEAAAQSGDLDIVEKAGSGEQGSIRLTNTSSAAVFLLDGQELTGAMQDRALNMSVLAPAGETLDIPVSCVEAARWEPAASGFGLAPRIQFATGRAQRMAQVTVSLLAGEGPSSDQVDVWAAIDERSTRLSVVSDTRAHAAIYIRLASRLSRFVNALAAVAGQAGAIYGIGGRIIGMDLFDSGETYRACHAKLIASAAIDALAEPNPAAVPPPQLTCAARFIQRVATARTLRFAGVGQGENVRLSGQFLTGGALIDNNRVVHMSAFDLLACGYDAV